MGQTGRPRKLTPEDVLETWEVYKRECDEHTVVRTEFSQKLGRFITEEVPSPVTYTKLGLCIKLGISRQAFAEYYENDERFIDIIDNIRHECEQDVRRKFEDRTLPSQLSALWMSKYGYSVRNEQDIKGAVPVVISGDDDVSD